LSHDDVTSLECKEDRCALFDQHTGECSILSLEKTMRYMENRVREDEDLRKIERDRELEDLDD